MARSFVEEAGDVDGRKWREERCPCVLFSPSLFFVSPFSTQTRCLAETSPYGPIQPEARLASIESEIQLVCLCHFWCGLIVCIRTHLLSPETQFLSAQEGMKATAIVIDPTQPAAFCSRTPPYFLPFFFAPSSPLLFLSSPSRLFSFNRPSTYVFQTQTLYSITPFS
jgi:hypothetical protein